MAGASPQQPAGVAPDRADALPPLAEGTFCPQCNYDLRGLTSERCPECGLDLGDVRTHESLLPWVRRREIGWLRAYWGTVWLVTARSKRFRLEIYRPVAFADAELFRRLNVLHAYVPLLIGSVISLALYWQPLSDFFGTLTIPTWLALQAALLFWLNLATILPRVFFHPRDWPIEKQNRAIALSYYASAGLAWTGPLGVALSAIQVLQHIPVAMPGPGMGWQIGILRWCEIEALLLTLGIVGLVWWTKLIKLCRTALRGSVVHCAGIAIAVPLIWLVSLAVALLLLLVGPVYLLLMLGSLF